MKKNNKKCVVCGKVYTYCPDCSQYSHLPKWYTIFHDENCREIYNISACYEQNKITFNEASKQLASCDLSGLDNGSFNPLIKKHIVEILGNVQTIKTDIQVEEHMEDKNENDLSEKNGNVELDLIEPVNAKEDTKSNETETSSSTETDESNKKKYFKKKRNNVTTE